MSKTVAGASLILFLDLDITYRTTQSKTGFRASARLRPSIAVPTLSGRPPPLASHSRFAASAT